MIPFLSNRREVISQMSTDVKHLTKDYGFGRGVFDVSFHVDKGEVFDFRTGTEQENPRQSVTQWVFPNRIVVETQIFGKESFHQYHEILQSVGYIPGEIALLPAGLTGWEFLRMMQSITQRHKDEERLHDLLNEPELDPSGDITCQAHELGRKAKACCCHRLYE